MTATTATSERAKAARKPAAPVAPAHPCPREDAPEPLTLLTVLAEEGLPLHDPESLFGVTIRDYTRPTPDDRWWTFSTPHGRRYRLSPDGETAERWAKTEWASIGIGSMPESVELFSAALTRHRVVQWRSEQTAKALLLQAEALLGREALRELIALGYRAGATDGAGRLFSAADPMIAALLDEVRTRMPAAQGAAIR